MRQVPSHRVSERFRPLYFGGRLLSEACPLTGEHSRQTAACLRCAQCNAAGTVATLAQVRVLRSHTALARGGVWHRQGGGIHSHLQRVADRCCDCSTICREPSRLPHRQGYPSKRHATEARYRRQRNRPVLQISMLQQALPPCGETVYAGLGTVAAPSSLASCAGRGLSGAGTVATLRYYLRGAGHCRHAVLPH